MLKKRVAIRVFVGFILLFGCLSGCGSTELLLLSEIGNLPIPSLDSPNHPAAKSFFAGQWVDHSGNVFIADYANGVIRNVTFSTGVINTVAGMMGSFGSSGDGGQATTALLNYPVGVAADSTGNFRHGFRQPCCSRNKCVNWPDHNSRRNS